MRFQVRWSKIAGDQLARVWLQAKERAEVTAAAHELEGLLSSAPMAQGESRDAGRRIVYHGPLAVFFHVDELQRVDSVLQVRSSRKPSP